MPEPDTTPAADDAHVCDNCEGIDSGSCLMNPDRTEPDNPTATALARHVADHPLSTVLAATRLLGWRLAIRPTAAFSGRTETGATTAKPQAGGGEAEDSGADTTASGFTWAQTVASYGVGPTATIDIDIHAPGYGEPVAVEIPLADARTLHDMLGGVLAEHDGGTSAGDLRERYAAALWAAAEHTIIAEWICCEPLNPRHDLCAQGYAALRMIRSCIIDDPEAYKPAPLPDAVLAVRDQEMQALRAQVQQQVDAKIGVAGEWGNALADNVAAEAAVSRVHEWIAGEPVTAHNEFGNGYREALRDISDLLGTPPPADQDRGGQ